MKHDFAAALGGHTEATRLNSTREMRAILHGYWEHELLGEFNCILSRAGGVPDFWHPNFVERITAMADDPHWRQVASSLITRPTTPPPS